MKRRAFIAARAARRLAARARAQQAERVRRIGVLMHGALENDPDRQARLRRFMQGLKRTGLDRRSQLAPRYPLGRTGDSRSLPSARLPNWSRSPGRL